MSNRPRSSVLLDTASNAPSTTLSSYCTKCSNAVTKALTDWKPIRETANAQISHGYIEDNTLISMLWTTTYVNPPSNLIQHLKDLFIGDNETLKKHALEWDATFHDAELLGKITDVAVAGQGLTTAPLLIHWQFNATPLAGRDMVYVVSAKEDIPSPKDDWISRTTYAYASVHDEWIETVLINKSVPTTGRVRSMNCFPSCDRVTVYKDGRVQIDHLMTTSIGGWVPTCCFNNLFKSALIDANCHESEAMRKYALSLCTK